jgi:hypothetical protein
MNKQELIEEIKQSNEVFPKMPVLYLIEQLDEPQPLKLKDIISRMKQLFPLSRSEWIDEILKEFGEEFGLWKYKAGYEQGKLEGIVEREKVTIPQFVADWIKYCKNTNVTMTRALLVGEVDFYNYANQKDLSRLTDFFIDGKNQKIFARAWLDGYEVEKEKRYWVKLKAVDQYLVSAKDEKFLGFLQSKLRSKFTRKELEDLGFGWVFDCEGIEIEEVEE